MSRFAALLAVLPVLAAAATAPATGPELPRVFVDTASVTPSGRTIAVPAGGNVQAALDTARPGDVIALAAGATFTGPFTLPAKPGSGWIVVRTSAADGSLPAPGARVDPSYADVMPKLVAASRSVIIAAPGAHHYRFIGVELRPRDGAFLHNLVQLGDREISADKLPSHIIFDRCYLHGDLKKGTRRGIAMNSSYTAVIDSYLSDFKEVGADSQAIAGWNGSGPFKIVNNYLEAAGENVIFGGADPFIPQLVPSDIAIRQNHFSKPLAWKADDPSYAGTPWTIKNLLELKNARRVLIEGNLFERNWVQAQSGFAILFTVRNQDGAAPWSVVEDVTFVSNVVRHTAAGINVLGRDDIHSSQQTRRILIKNNLFAIDGVSWGGSGRLLQLLRGTAGVVIEHNTAFQTGDIIAAGGEPHRGFMYRNNITPHNRYGVGGDGTFGNARLTLTTYFPRAVFRGNVIAGGQAARYPADNFFPASVDDVGFVDRKNCDYRLAASSHYRKAGTDGKNPGVDFETLAAAMMAKSSPRARPGVKGGSRRVAKLRAPACRLRWGRWWD